jgi:hypothetical protein
MPSVATLGVGDVRFGRAVPAGRTIQTVYPASYVSDISIFDMGMRPGPSSWPPPGCTAQPQSLCAAGTNPGRTYRFYTGAAVVPFGFGLSYSTFNYSFAPSAPPAGSVLLDAAQELVKELASENRTFFRQEELGSQQARGGVSYAVAVTNTGLVDADDAVLGFLVPPNAGVDGAPLKTLFGFERVHVKAGDTKVVFLYPSAGDFAQVDRVGERRVQAREYTVQFGEPRSGAMGQGFLEHRLHAVLSAQLRTGLSQKST